MDSFNYLMLGLACVAGLLFVLIAVGMVRRTRGEGVEPPDPRPEPVPVVNPIPAPQAHAPTAPGFTLAPRPDMPFPPYTAWRLFARTLANPDSAGGPLYRLRLVPEGDLPPWQAGAIARVYCGPAQDVLVPGGMATAPEGDYMIGSLHADGAVDLVVRVPTSAQAGDGRRSNWLCHEIDTGQQVALTLRDDPGFAPPPDDVPLILIGNATGIAALHAHLKARPQGTRNWLIFGDRSSAEDQALATEIAEWVATGHLERCDLVFPGEGQEQRRVVDQIHDARAPLLDWIFAGGAIYVCGSRRMGDDVTAALSTLIDAGTLEALAEAGLYRMSVY